GASDCCLFHFSGHGARSAAPEAFWGLEPDHKLESIVCWDSRQSGGHDLMDKELSYLVWQASQGKDMPFITVMDCCHSGDMRTAEEVQHDRKLEVVNVRTLRDFGGALPAEQFLGVEHYHKSNTGQLIPPLGRRVHLGAARNTEYAKEVLVGGQSRGIFTYCLIEALEKTGPLISYADLLNRVNLRIRNSVKEQSSQLGASKAEDRNRGFLFSRIDTDKPSYLVAWNKDLNNWILNAGAVHGISAGDAESFTMLELTEDKRNVTVESVQPNLSVINGMDGYDKKRTYVAIIKRRAVPKFKLAFSKDSDTVGMEILKRVVQAQSSDVIGIQDQYDDRDFIIHAKDGAYFLSGLNDDRPIFQRVLNYTQETANIFLKDLEHVAKWQQVLNLYNPDTGIRDGEVKIELKRLSAARKVEEMDDDAPMEVVDWQSEPAVFSYINNGGSLYKPALQLRICNTGFRPLWFSVLYLGSDFSVMNRLLPKQVLAPGEETWALDNASGFPYRTIPLQIDDERMASVNEFIKIIVSTEELDTDMHNQKGLVADRGDKRAVVLRQSPKEKDWMTKTIGIQIKR
ncbi:MAG: caspase family protein, partial [Bacteroidetes bacterium]|nr:caspase family protein [Bacteroidota bacterium]